MSVWRVCLACVCAAVLTACDSSDPCATEECTQTAGSTSGGTTESSDTSGNRPEMVACGEQTCMGGDVCLVTYTEPNCINKENPDDTCPEGQQDTNCGGAGAPCCCEPAPDPSYVCDPATNCGETVNCECLAEVCQEICSSAGDGVFACEPAQPA